MKTLNTHLLLVLAAILVSSCARVSDGDNKGSNTVPPPQRGTSSTTGTVIQPGEEEPFGTPVDENGAGASEVAAIAGDGMHMCALLKNHQLKCWGENPYGQLDIHAATDSSGKSFNVSKTQFSKVSVGNLHTCGLLRGGANEGKAVCFGNKGSWLKVPTGKLLDISCGSNYTCFLDENGKLGCVGDDIDFAPKNSPRRQIKAEDLVKYGIDPLSKNENQDFSSKIFKNLKAGDSQICAQGKNDDIVYCMGANLRGMGESINQKALDYALGLNSVMIIADDGTLSVVGVQRVFPGAKNLASLAGLKLRNVVNSFSGNIAFFTGPNNHYDDGTTLPENSLVISSSKTTIYEDALGYASNRGGQAASNLYAQCILKKNAKLACSAFVTGGKDNPDSLIVKDVPKDLI